MKINKRGFGTIEAILIVVIIAAISGTGWFVYNAKKKTNDTLNKTAQLQSDAQKSVHTSADPTANWTAYTSEKGKFSVKYPPTWVQPAHKEACGDGLLDRSLYLGPDNNSVLRCGSEFFGQIGIDSQTGDKHTDNPFSSGYKDTVVKNVTVDGVSGTRTSAVAQGQGEGLGAYFDGTIVVRYVFVANGNTYVATYVQAPAGKVPSTDVLTDFDLMVTSTLKFN